jgi:hypothetical protein
MIAPNTRAKIQFAGKPVHEYVHEQARLVMYTKH